MKELEVIVEEEDSILAKLVKDTYCVKRNTYPEREEDSKEVKFWKLSYTKNRLDHTDCLDRVSKFQDTFKVQMWPKHNIYDELKSKLSLIY